MTLALLTDGLWGRADLAPALHGLARAFELLELAAVHLYLLPWRKEFTTIKVGRRAAWRFPAPATGCWAPPDGGYRWDEGLQVSTEPDGFQRAQCASVLGVLEHLLAGFPWYS